MITFPPEIALIDSQDEKCSGSVSSSGKKLICETKIDTNQLIVTHNNNLDLFKNELLEITLERGAYNPQTTRKSSGFYFETKLLDEGSGQFFMVRKSVGSSIFVQPNKPNKLQNLEITRSVSEIKKMTDLDIKFNSFNQIPVRAKIEILIPK